MVARQGFIFKLDEDVPNHDDLMNIMSNGHLSSYFQSFAREVRGRLNIIPFKWEINKNIECVVNLRDRNETL